jgi:hypothetical protein
MPRTEVRSAQIKDATIGRDDLNLATPGQAVVAKIVAGAGVTLSSTGADTGTGDVTVSVSSSTAHHVSHETGGSDALTALSAAILTSGTLPDARLSSNVQMKPVAESDVTGLVTDLAAKAPLASPALTGTPTTTSLAASGTVTANRVGVADGTFSTPALYPTGRPDFGVMFDTAGGRRKILIGATLEEFSIDCNSHAVSMSQLALGGSIVMSPASLGGPIGLLLQNPASSPAIGFGGSSSAFPMISRGAVATGLDVRLADGSDWAPLYAKTPTAGVSNNQVATTAFVASAAPAAHHVSHEPGGSDALAALSASILTSGTIPDARLSSNIPRLDAAPTFTAPYHDVTASAPLVGITDTSQAANQRRFQFYNQGQFLSVGAALDNTTFVSPINLTLNRLGDCQVGHDIYEKGRTTPMGHWANVPFAAANFAANSGGGTWTVGSAAVITNRYSLVGKILFWNIYVSWFSGANTIAGTVTIVQLTLPGGNIGNPAGQACGVGYVVVGSVAGNAYNLSLSAGSSFVTISPFSGAAFTAGALGMVLNMVWEIN